MLSTCEDSLTKCIHAFVGMCQPSYTASEIITDKIVSKAGYYRHLECVESKKLIINSLYILCLLIRYSNFVSMNEIINKSWEKLEKLLGAYNKLELEKAIDFEKFNLLF